MKMNEWHFKLAEIVIQEEDKVLGITTSPRLYFKPTIKIKNDHICKKESDKIIDLGSSSEKFKLGIKLSALVNSRVTQKNIKVVWLLR